jgi:hypothetical protein
LKEKKDDKKDDWIAEKEYESKGQKIIDEKKDEKYAEKMSVVKSKSVMKSVMTSVKKWY